MKAKTIFYCTECGNETPKWQGKCPACGAVLEYLSPALLPARLNYLCARADLYLCPQCGRYEFYRDPRWIERDKEKKK